MTARKPALIYVTRDIERALGMMPHEGYHIVSNRSTYGEIIRRQYPSHVTLIEDDQGDMSGTGTLLDDPQTAELVDRTTASTGERPNIMIFKNTARIEPIARARDWKLINPPAATSEKVENKISQVMWLGSLERSLPAHKLDFTKNIEWTGTPFVLQWAHGHTGGGTILITDDVQLTDLKHKFPERRTRITEYIEGPSFTLNVVVTPTDILPSSVSYQITGLKPFTDAPFATIGNDWGLADRLLTAADRAVIADLARELGAKMQQEQWRGLFGIDIIKETKTGKIYLIELNARQPASTTYESHLQSALRAAGLPEASTGMTTFEAHVAALLGEPVRPLIPVTDGAQIVQRITSQKKSLPDDIAGTLTLDGFHAIPYDNTAENADLLRIQSPKSIMTDHNQMNELGMRIAAAIATS
jgi:predicted ATP-grasp superfamily ATP-dependent carboligase